MSTGATFPVDPVESAPMDSMTEMTYDREKNKYHTYTVFGKVAPTTSITLSILNQY